MTLYEGIMNSSFPDQKLSLLCMILCLMIYSRFNCKKTPANKQVYDVSGFDNKHE